MKSILEFTSKKTINKGLISDTKSDIETFVKEIFVFEYIKVNRLLVKTDIVPSKT